MINQIFFIKCDAIVVCLGISWLIHGLKIPKAFLQVNETTWSVLEQAASSLNYLGHYFKFKRTLLL